MRWQISEELHLPPKLPDQGLPGRARARFRCCAPSCATRSAPWAPSVPQRAARQGKKPISYPEKESWCICVCHEIAIHVHIYIYLYYVHKSQCIPFISPWSSIVFNRVPKLHRRNRSESQQHIDHTWRAHKGRLTGSWVPSKISPQKKDDICGSYMVNIWLWRYIYSWTSSGWVPSGIFFTKSELENGPVEIVDLPSYKMVILQFAMLVYQRVSPKKKWGSYPPNKECFP